VLKLNGGSLIGTLTGNLIGGLISLKARGIFGYFSLVSSKSRIFCVRMIIRSAFSAYFFFRTVVVAANYLDKLVRDTPGNRLVN
jgi:hypothetical protein